MAIPSKIAETWWSDISAKRTLKYFFVNAKQ